MFAIPTKPGIGVHEYEFAAAAGTEEAFAASQRTSKVLALVGIELFTNNEFYASVKKGWETSLKNHK